MLNPIDRSVDLENLMEANFFSSSRKEKVKRLEISSRKEVDKY